MLRMGRNVVVGTRGFVVRLLRSLGKQQIIRSSKYTGAINLSGCIKNISLVRIDAHYLQFYTYIKRIQLELPLISKLSRVSFPALFQTKHEITKTCGYLQPSCTIYCEGRL